MAYHFLLALETTDCLGARTGWTPFYLTVWNENQLVGAQVFYLKTNSYGEYIFDFSWAQAFKSSGKNYYPKLVSAAPFTPATGPKILLHDKLSAEEGIFIGRALAQEVQGLAKRLGVSSVHSLFIPASEFGIYQNQGFLIRQSYQFHWRNQGYQSFEDFLQNLRSKRRREILRERAQVNDSGIQIQRLTGEQILPEHALLFYQFYLKTVDKRGGHDYLTPEFFTQIFATLKDQILLVLATHPDGSQVAGALNYFGRQTLFGRNWGCLEDYKFLHFELCYYQGIEFAIERNFSLFEAGAQGEHKFTRGFLPSLTFSAHQIYDSHWDPLIRAFIEREKVEIKTLFEDYEAHTPYSRTPTRLFESAR